MSEITLRVERGVGGSGRIIVGGARRRWIVRTIGGIIGDGIVHCRRVGRRGAAGG